MSTFYNHTDYRRALGSFPSGVTVVATREADGTPRGFTASSFTSVSMEPRLVLVCIAHSAASYAVFSQSAHFSISVLATDQSEVSTLFASRQPDKFERCDWVPGEHDMPIVEACSAHFECARHQTVDAGDHLILIGRVLAFGSAERAPLAYCRGSYARVADLPRHA